MIQGFGGSAENDSRDIQGLYSFGRSGKMWRFLEQQGAIDTTARGTVKEEYQKMNPVPGHDMEGRRFPSRMFLQTLEEEILFWIWSLRLIFEYAWKTN